jgi:iron complex transport system substrate-binding protein
MTLKQIKCRKCKKMLFRGQVVEVEIKCPKCGHIQIINGEKKA